MKQNRIIIVFLLSFICCLNIKAADWNDFDRFFHYKNYQAFKTIAQLYAPNNEFYNGFFDDVRCPDGIDKDSYDILLRISFDNGILMFKLHLANLYFDKLEVLYSTEWIEPYDAKKVAKEFADKMKDTYKSSEIEWIEKKYETSLYSMDIKQLCLAALTLQYWKHGR